MRWRKLFRFAILAVALAVCTSAGPPPASPLLSVLDRFIAPGVPAAGPAEGAPIPRNWPEPASIPERPGSGLAQHPMLYAGEGYNTIFLVNHGKVVWTWSTGRGGEIDDVWMLTNGHILFARQFHVEEVTPQKQVVWHYDPPTGTEVHSCQPIGLDKVLLVQNGLPPKLMVINKKTGVVEIEHALPAQSLTDPKTVHPQFRRIRMTAKGTYLAPFLMMNKVVEYDKDFKPIWTCEISSPWAADRLANGDTVIFSSTGGTKLEDRPNIIQILEVAPDKKLVWVLQDWKNLGPATTAQFLDEPGVPEHPGDLQR